jgi:hypothetical protein
VSLQRQIRNQGNNDTFTTVKWMQKKVAKRLPPLCRMSQSESDERIPRSYVLQHHHQGF